MPKYARGSRDTLTGGTKDVNPQWFKMQLTCSAVTKGVLYSGSYPLPVQRLNNGRNSMVMEILTVHWQSKNMSSATPNEWKFYLAAKAFTFTTEPSAVDSSLLDIVKVVEKSQIGVYEATWIHDLTDGQGHGVLVGADQLSLGAFWDTTNATNAPQIDCWVLYRWKNVRLQEYIGIVQSTSL